MTDNIPSHNTSPSKKILKKEVSSVIYGFITAHVPESKRPVFPADTLTKLGFDHGEKRALAPALNDQFHARGFMIGATPEKTGQQTNVEGLVELYWSIAKALGAAKT